MGIRLVALAMAMSGSLLVSNAHAQAAAEAALTHGLASSAGSSLGNALGKATNQMAGRVAQQTSNATARQRVTVVKPGTRTGATGASSLVASSGAAPTNGSMIVSIQGGEHLQHACDVEAKSTVGASSATKTTNDVRSQSTGCSKTSDQPSDAAHPSEITLPAAK